MLRLPLAANFPHRRLKRSVKRFAYVLASMFRGLLYGVAACIRGACGVTVPGVSIVRYIRMYDVIIKELSYTIKAVVTSGFRSQLYRAPT